MSFKCPGWLFAAPVESCCWIVVVIANAIKTRAENATIFIFSAVSGQKDSLLQYRSTTAFYSCVGLHPTCAALKRFLILITHCNL